MEEKAITLTLDEALITIESLKDRIVSEKEWMLNLQHKCARGISKEKEHDYQQLIDIRIDRIGYLQSAITKLTAGK